MQIVKELTLNIHRNKSQIARKNLIFWKWENIHYFALWPLDGFKPLQDLQTLFSSVTRSVYICIFLSFLLSFIVVDEVVVAVGLGIVVVVFNAEVELDVEANVCVVFITVSE